MRSKEAACGASYHGAGQPGRLVLFGVSCEESNRMIASTGISIEISPLSERFLVGVAPLLGQLGYPCSPKDVRRRWQAMGDEARGGCLVACEGERVVGLIQFGAKATLASDPRVEILALVVDSESRGKGIGSALIRAAEIWGRGRGLRSAFFGSRTDRADAHRLYRRLGYDVLKTWHVFGRAITPERPEGAADVGLEKETE